MGSSLQTYSSRGVGVGVGVTKGTRHDTRRHDNKIAILRILVELSYYLATRLSRPSDCFFFSLFFLSLFFLFFLFSFCSCSIRDDGGPEEQWSIFIYCRPLGPPVHLTFYGRNEQLTVVDRCPR